MLINSFLDYLRFERNYSQKTIVSYETDLSQFEDFVAKKGEEEGETIKIEEVDADLIRQWIIHLMEKGDGIGKRKEAGNSTTSVNRKLSALRSFFKFLLIRGVVTVDPTRKIKGPKNKKPLPSFLKESEMNKLLDETDFGDDFAGCRDKMIIELFYATGIRRSELIELKDADIDFSASLIKVTGKGNKQRIIPFGQELKNSMLTYINIRNEALPVRADAFLVKEDGGKLYSGKVYKIVIKHLSGVATNRKKSPHVLRHTFATAMLNNNAELNAVKELLGHQSLAATEVYTHTTFEELKKIYEQAHPRA